MMVRWIDTAVYKKNGDVRDDSESRCMIGKCEGK